MVNEDKKIRAIFIGTPDFSVPSLRALIKDKQFDIIAVITQPDKKAGRKQLITPPLIKVEAEKYNIKVLQPEKIIDLQLKIKNLKPDIIIVVAYAQLIPAEILKLPKYGCVNLHASLLPKYRGAAVIQAAILNGDKKAGATIIKLEKKLDSGPILAQTEIKISEDETTGTLYYKLSDLGAKLLLSTLKKYISGKIKATPQDDVNASYVGIIKKKDGLINWEKPALNIERFIRAMTPWPSAFTNIKNGVMVKIINVEPRPLEINKNNPGKLFLYKNQLAVQCGKDALIINKLQLEGKRIITGKDFLRGYNKLKNAGFV